LAQIRRRARAAIAQVANATLRARALQIWSEATTACASDSTRFSAWEQNLLTEWHVRYGVPGIMIYWRRPPLSREAVYREATAAARAHGWRVPSYHTVYRVIVPASEDAPHTSG